MLRVKVTYVQEFTVREEMALSWYFGISGRKVKRSIQNATREYLQWNGVDSVRSIVVKHEKYMENLVKEAQDEINRNK